jgi:hypothetical protein
MPLTTVQSGMMDSIAQYNSFKNRIINGAMGIDQRNAGASVATINGGVYTVDRYQAAATQAAKYTVQRNAGSVTPPAGFSNYVGITSTSAYSVLTTDSFYFQQSIEGYNWADMAYGTASAATSTLSFWIYSSLTGTFGGVIKGFDGSSVVRSYPFTYSIPTANTWTYISVTIPGDTTASLAWSSAQSKTNGYGLIVLFSMGTGATFSGAVGSWSTNNHFGATGATSVVGTNGATWYLTGLQIEKGSTATAFDYRPYTTELQLCQRYYEKSFAVETAPAANVTFSGNSSYVTANAFGSVNGRTSAVSFKLQKRGSPTIVIYRTDIVASNDNSIAYFNSSGSWINYATASIAIPSQWGFATDFTTAGTSWGQALMTVFAWAASSEL